MLIFSISFPDLINFLTLWIPLKEGFGWKEAQRQGDFSNNFSIYTYTSQNIYTGLCKCMWQIFTLALCKCKVIDPLKRNWAIHIYIFQYTLQQDKCKCEFFLTCKWFTLILNLHAVYTAIDTYTHNTNWYPCSDAQSSLGSFFIWGIPWKVVQWMFYKARNYCSRHCLLKMHGCCSYIFHWRWPKIFTQTHDNLYSENRL